MVAICPTAFPLAWLSLLLLPAAVAAVLRPWRGSFRLFVVVPRDSNIP